MEISNFFAVENGRAVSLAPADGTADADVPAAPAAARERTGAQPLHLIVYVDNVNLLPTHRGRILRQLREFLLARRQLEARVMLASNERSLVVRQAFTSVPHEIFVAVDELEKSAAPSPRFAAERRDLLRAIERVNVEAGSGLFGTKTIERV